MIRTPLLPGQPVRPLDVVTIDVTSSGRLTVTDSEGRTVFDRDVSPGPVPIVVGGNLGSQSVVFHPASGHAPEKIFWTVEAETEIDDEGGEFGELLRYLHYTMTRFGENRSVRWRGRTYQFFVCWLRDHVHTLKGMKYFERELKSGIDLYRKSQRSDGMIWDNVHFRSEDPNYWDVRFKEGGYIQPFEDMTAEFKRIPVENDVEYLFVEGIYFTWKATGDNAWMAASLDAAIRALDYSMRDRCRWSAKFGLLKRGYTIDTWDFQNEEDAAVCNDPMRIDPDRTRFGIMFGDNTGYFMACRYLAEMLAVVGRHDEATDFRARADEVQKRLDAVSWNGRFFTHHVPEEPNPPRDLGVDESAQVSLSNAYSLNRGIRLDQADAIVRTYQGIRENLPPGSPGEWYTIYPPFGKGFGHHGDVWQYMNGGVTPIVAGELAHGAFEFGHEAYGQDILRRVHALGKRIGPTLHCAYTGAMPPPPERTFHPLDLSQVANVDTSGKGAPGVPGWTGEGENDLHEFPTQPFEVQRIPFAPANPEKNGRRAAVGLSVREGYVNEASVEVPSGTQTLYLLHNSSRTRPGGVAGMLRWEYADGTTAAETVVEGINILRWWMPVRPESRGRRRLDIGWAGTNPQCPFVTASIAVFTNPHPDRVPERVRFEASPDGAFWFVLAATASPDPGYLEPSPVSFGIPDNWGAAAVVYALIEGLAGVKDLSTRYGVARIAPRWLAAGVASAKTTVVYPASNGYVAYRYTLDEGGRRLSIEATGSGERAMCHVLLPENRHVESVLVDGLPVAFAETTVGASSYVDFEIALPGPIEATVRYR